MIDTRTSSAREPDPLLLRAIAWEDVPGESEACGMRICIRSEACGMRICFRFASALADALRGTGFVDWPAR